MKIAPPNALTARADHYRNYFHQEVPDDTTIEDLLKPGYWSHVSRALTRGDLIDVMTHDFSLDIQLRVLAVRDMLVDVRVVLIRHHPDDDQEEAIEERDQKNLPPLPDGYAIAYTPKGAKSGYYVKFRDDILEKRFQRKADAYDYGLNHAREAGFIQ